uniref:Condensin complex subunit 1 C-terminal domain-containing protein n=1 Tax=Arcella intermedia TaxID=1963864 RepID=A0A6B2L5F2_9EUKA
MECFVGYLVQLCCAKDRTVRFRACQMLAGITTTFTQDTQLDEMIQEELFERLHERVRDKVAKVRLMASKALAPLQDTSDPDDPALVSLLNAMSKDPSSEVRKCILNRIGVSSSTISDIWARCTDIDPSIRKKSYVVLREKISMDKITPNKIVFIINTGLSDLDGSVKSECIELIKVWLKSQSNDVVKFLKYLNVVENELVVTPILKTIFQFKKIENSEFINSDEINCEFSLFWRVYCEWIVETKPFTEQDEIFQDILPDMMNLCELISKFRESQELDSNRFFVVYQLLSLCSLLDYADEIGRRETTNLMMNIIKTSDNERELRLSIDVLINIYSSNEEWGDKVLSVINLKYQSADENTDYSKTWTSILSIVYKFLEHTQKKATDSDMLELLSTIIIPGSNNIVPAIHEKGLKC